MKYLVEVYIENNLYVDEDRPEKWKTISATISCNSFNVLNELTTELNRMIATGGKILGSNVVGYEVGEPAREREDCYEC